jgi:pimeloyl-ACP methyl ester carboxylesterase
MSRSTRGQGRSPYSGFETFHYDDFARDAIELLDHLKLYKVAVVGWSDGAMTGLNLAMNYSTRIERVFAHGAQLNFNMSIPGLDDPIINSKTGSLESDLSNNGTTFSVNGKLHTKRLDAPGTPYACTTLSPVPQNCKAMIKGVYA